MKRIMESLNRIEGGLWDHAGGGADGGRGAVGGVGGSAGGGPMMSSDILGRAEGWNRFVEADGGVGHRLRRALGQENGGR